MSYDYNSVTGSRIENYRRIPTQTQDRHCYKCLSDVDYRINVQKTFLSTYIYPCF